MSGTIALIVGAGRGHRFGGDVPKQYCALDGEPVLRHTLRAFTDHPGIDHVQPVIHPDDIELYRTAAAGLDIREPVWGGASRQDSVRLGLEHIAGLGPDLVLVHDAARPFVSGAVISRVLTALESHGGAIPALAVTDTLKHAGDAGRIDATVPRDGLWRAQTPQGFRFAELLAAHHAAAGEALTDDAAVAERHGLSVVIIDGSEENVKITTAADLDKAQSRNFRFQTGMGFDVHAFGDGDHVQLCGHRIAHDHGLVGHSDADVGLHAVTDAVLGAIAAGDIGDHFPPSDPRWKGAPSEIFLTHAAGLVAAKGGEIVNVDVTLICEFPKIGPHRAAMRECLAEILGIDQERVSIKATTTERLGFTGRGEGIAAQAITCVRLTDASAR